MALSGAQLNAVVSGDIDGDFTYDPAIGAKLGAGRRELKVTFEPENQQRYFRASTTVTLMVQPAPLTIVAG